MDDMPIIRTSERGTFSRCIFKWYLAWRKGLVPRRPSLDALWFGTGIHLALAEWYCGPGLKRGPHPAETWQAFAKDEVGYVKTEKASNNDEIVAQYEDAVKLGIAMLEGYIDLYGIDGHMHIIQPEQTFAIEVPWPGADRQKLYDVEDGAILARYVGTYDLVFRDLRNDWIVLGEHKTAKQIFLGHLPLDNQAGSYWAIATQTLRKMGLIGPKENLRGIEYNFLRKAIPDDRPQDAEGYYCNRPNKADYVAAFEASSMHPEQLKHEIKRGMKLEDFARLAELHGITVLGSRSKIQPPPLFQREMVHRTPKERAQQLRRIQDEAVWMEAVRDELLPLTKTTAKDCSYSCQFYDLCELHERGGNWRDFARLQFRTVDMYADHRKSTEESDG